MTDPEAEIMRHFRRYLAQAGQMVFFQPGAARNHSASFNRAMESLILEGLIVRERHRNSYSLTKTGYRASRHKSYNEIQELERPRRKNTR